MIFLSILLHLIDDFVLQLSCLNKLKQKQWWINECEKEGIDYSLYRNDYKMALFLHGLEWSIMISLPIIFMYEYDNNYNNIILGIIIVINAIIHAIIDDKKANQLEINLIMDQILHIIQIIFLYLVIAIII